MREHIKLAWRNIWRNKRRTLITAASIFFAVFFAIFMRGFQLGTYDHMINQSIESYLGFIQIQDAEYFYDPGIDNSFTFSKGLLDTINKTDGLKVVVPRITSASYGSFEQQSKLVITVGIDAEKEKSSMNLEYHLVRYRFTREVIDTILKSVTLTEKQQERIEKFEDRSFKSITAIINDLNLKDSKYSEIISQIEKLAKFEGEYLKPDDDGVLVSDKLSKYLKINIGDTLVLLSQGYHGASAAGLFPVRGIVNIPAPDLDNKLVYMSLKQAQTYLSMPGMVSSITINLKNPDDMLKIQKELAANVNPEKYAVKNWMELNPILKQQIEGDSKSGQIFLFILYLIIFFGIFGTVLMMISERKREFGVMVAIGMRKKKLATIVTIEMIFVGLVGAISGLLACVPIIIIGYYRPIQFTGSLAEMMEYMGFDPIMPMKWFDAYFYNQAIIVIIMIILACYFPLKSIRNMRVIESLRS